MTAITLRLCDGPCRLEGRRDLLIQLHAIRHHDERPVPRHLPQHLLGEEDHREALPAPLRLPKHASPSMPHRACREHRADGIVYPKELVILPNNLHQPGLMF